MHCENWETRGFNVGFNSLAPIFAAFSYLLLQDARNRELAQLGFVARDGALLKASTEIMAEVTHWSSPPRFHYLYLSRIALALPWFKGLNAQSYREVHSAVGHPPTLGVLLRFLGLSSDTIPPDLISESEDYETPITDFAQLVPLLNDRRVSHAIERETVKRLHALKNYLVSENFFSAENSALVDIGWRGSLQKSLNEIFKDDQKFKRPISFYLGLWHENGVHESLGADAIGLLADYNRGRHVLEGSAYYLSLPLEAVSRAEHGSVLGYDLLGDGRPVLEQPVTQGDVLNAEIRSPIISGILEGVASLAAQWGTSMPKPGALRRRIQRHMLRLAFFPSNDEIQALGTLRHTEGHTPGWSRPLIERTSGPLKSPKDWISGMNSPWRSGYVAATAGKGMAASFLALEAACALLPAEVKTGIRRFAHRISRQARQEHGGQDLHFSRSKNL